MNLVFNYLFVSFIITTALIFTACNSITGSNNKAVFNSERNSRIMKETTSKKIEVKSDIEGLEKIVNLPVRPVEVQWVEEIFDNSGGAIPGPSDYRLAALLKYDEKGTSELLKTLNSNSEKQASGKAEIKSWFPEEIKSKAKTDTGETFLEGASYSPEKFFKNSYRNGNLIRVGDTNYFVLNLFSF